jgi:flagellar capping protein FliD
MGFMQDSLHVKGMLLYKCHAQNTLLSLSSLIYRNSPTNTVNTVVIGVTLAC